MLRPLVQDGILRRCHCRRHARGGWHAQHPRPSEFAVDATRCLHAAGGGAVAPTPGALHRHRHEEHAEPMEAPWLHLTDDRNDK